MHVWQYPKFVFVSSSTTEFYFFAEKALRVFDYDLFIILSLHYFFSIILVISLFFVTDSLVCLLHLNFIFYLPLYYVPSMLIEKLY